MESPTQDDNQPEAHDESLIDDPERTTEIEEENEEESTAKEASPEKHQVRRIVIESDEEEENGGVEENSSSVHGEENETGNSRPGEEGEKGEEQSREEAEDEEEENIRKERKIQIQEEEQNEDDTGLVEGETRNEEESGEVNDDAVDDEVHEREDGEIEEEENEKEDEDHGEEQVPEERAGDVTELMQNIFGDDMSDDDEDKDGANEDGTKQTQGSDEDEPKLLRVEQSDDEGDLHGKQWDFDVMLSKKRQERRRRRRKDGSIDLMADADEQIKVLVDAMTEAATGDRGANIDRRPAVKKRKMLPIVKNTLMKADLFEAMIDNGMISAISEWLAPLPDKSLPALEIRCTLLKILERWPNLEQGTLKQSGLGRAVMYLLKHPKETNENKTIAAKLIREWSRPIFQLESDFRSLSKEERTQRDFSQMPLAKRKRLSVDEESGIPIFSSSKKFQKNEEEESGKRPGDPGFIPRARVPKPSTKDYVVRPRPEIEGQFRGETKNKQASRLVKTQREFRQKNQIGKLKRAVGVNISGKNL